MTSRYQGAVYWLEAAAKQIEDSNCIDLESVYQCSENSIAIVQQLVSLERNPLRQYALRQVLQTLLENRALITRCHHHINSTTSSENEVTEPLQMDDNDDPQVRRCNKAITQTIHSSFNIKFCDVAGLTSAKQALRESVIIPIQYPHLFTGSRKPWKRILMYGPPGTGKTRLAQAVSGETDLTFYCVSSSDLISSWVGESERIIRGLFQHARQCGSQAILFIDEIDSVCRKRSNQEEEHTRRVKTELLRQMEGVDTVEDGLFILCATNCPWELDPAFIRRFQKRIYVPLPCRKARRLLFQLHTKDTAISITDSEWEEVVSLSDGCSGSDIANLTADALLEPIREMESALYWRRVSVDDNYYTPCEHTHQRSIRATLSDLHPTQVVPRQVSAKDFFKVFAHAHPTVSKELVSKYETFSSEAA